MSKNSKQMAKWSGRFGKEYTDRNVLSPEELDALYASIYRKTRTDLNQHFLDGLDRSIKILEVGSNVGNQLLCLQKMGYQNLYGIELQEYAVELSKSRTKNINIIQGSAFDIPFKDEFFDLVFTSGVLIHISRSDISLALHEIYRCTKRYIWGLEYYADEYTEIPYRGEKNLLWKTNFAKLYIDQFQDLELIKEKYLEYIDNDNVDSMYLIQKRK